MKKVFILFFVIILAVLLIIFVFNIFNNKSNNYVVSNINDINEAYTVKNCANKFYEYCKEYRDTNQNYIFELIDEEYLKYYDLNEYDFKQKIDIVDSDRLFIENAYKIQEKKDLALYIVKAKQLYKNEISSKEFSFMVKLDRKNECFSIFPNNYIEEKNLVNVKLGDKIKLNIISLKRNDNNGYDNVNKNLKDNVNDIFDDFSNLCTFYYKDLYNVIDENTKKEKYNTYEEFDKYLTSIYKDLVTMKLVSYEDAQKDGYVEYKCKDNNGRSYIFKAYSYITYTVIIE